MQNLTTEVNESVSEKYKTIYLRWSDLKTVCSSSSKQLLRHYLRTIEFLTRGGFYSFYPEVIPRSEYGINKNAFKDLNEIHQELGTLTVSRGHKGKIMYSYPADYPRSQKEWMTCGGYTQLDRGELNQLLKRLSDNELRVYFTLRRIYQSHRSPDLGVETWPKVVRESHLSISQPTFRKAIKGLEEQGFLSLAEPLKKSSRDSNRFIFVIKKISSKKPSNFLSPRIQEISPENAQNPEKLPQLKEDLIRDEICLKQVAKNTNENSERVKKKESDFNFYGLDELERPLDHKTVRSLLNSGLSREVVQESVMRFSRYYKHHPVQIANPVGYLVSSLRNSRELFVEPEWFLEEFYRGKDKGIDIVNTGRTDQDFSLKESFVGLKSIESVMADLRLEYLS